MKEKCDLVGQFLYVPEMVVFILPILLRIIDPKINRDNRGSIHPDR